MDKTLLVVSGGAEAVPGIRRATEMGLYVVVSDMNTDAPGFAHADDGIIASTYDIEQTVREATRYHRNVRPIDGVICIAADVPLTVARVAEALDLPGIPVEAAQLAMDKLAMKRRFVEQGISVPWFGPVHGPDELRTIIAERGYSIVIKPVDSRGARGVVRLLPGVDPDWAFEHARSNSPTARVMVEAYLEGPQVSTESVLLGDSAVTPGFSDRNYEFIERFAPYMIENGGQQPSFLHDEARWEIARCAEAAGRALGISRGIAKGDMVWTPEGAKVIEIAARLSGGWFSTDQIPLATGVDLVGAAIKLALGLDVDADDLVPRTQRGVAIRYFFPNPGRVVEIRNRERFEGEPWVHKIGFFVQPGDVLEPVSNHTKRAGFVITMADTRDEAVSLAERVVDGIDIVTVSL